MKKVFVIFGGIVLLAILSVGIWEYSEYFGSYSFGTGCIGLSYFGKEPHDAFYKEDLSFLTNYLTQLGYHKCESVDIDENNFHRYWSPDPHFSQLPIWCSIRYDLPDGHAQLLRIYFNINDPGFILVISGPGLVQKRFGNPLIRVAANMPKALRKEWYTIQKNRFEKRQ